MATRWSFLLASLVIGCGGTVATVDGGTGTDGGSGSDGGSGTDGGSSSGCPASQPSVGLSCSPQGIECEYGGDPNPACNTFYRCDPGGWSDLKPGGICPPPGPQCPASYQSVPANQDCTTEGLTCSYAEGECICTRSFGGPQRVTPGWYCFTTPAGCPSPRPAVGSSCSQEGQDCNYGACSGGIDLACKSGRWQPQEVPCPL